MKSFYILLIASISFGFEAQAQNICENLIAQAEAECDETMCASFGNNPCVRDGDFYEDRGICVYDETLPDLIKQYNKKNAKEKIGCDSDGSITTPPAVASFSCAVNASKVSFRGEIFDNLITATVSDSANELNINDFKSPKSGVEFNKLNRKKEDTYAFAKFYSDFNALQDLEFSFPKSITTNERIGKFSGYFTMYTDNGDIMAASKSLQLSCTAR